MIHVSPDFLGAQQAHLDLRVIYGRSVAARSTSDLVPGFAEQLKGGLLQAALRQGKSEQRGSGSGSG
jgi:hypothetical protein